MTWTDSVIPSKGETRITAKETTYAACSPPLLVLPVLSEAEGSVAEGSGGVRGGRVWSERRNPVVGRLYPTPAFAGASLAQPPLTKGRKREAGPSGDGATTHLENRRMSPAHVMSHHDCQALLNEFRQNLAAFYAALKLAPPYDSVEKTIRGLSALFETKTAEEQAQLLGDDSLRWKLHVQAFIDSGLHKKHRGIITGLARTDAIDQFPESLRYLLEPFRS